MVPAMRRGLPAGIAGRRPRHGCAPTARTVGVPGAEHPVEVLLPGCQRGLVDRAELAQVVGVHPRSPVVGAGQGVQRGPAGDLVHACAVEHLPVDEVPFPVAVGAGVEDGLHPLAALAKLGGDPLLLLLREELLAADAMLSPGDEASGEVRREQGVAEQQENRHRGRVPEPRDPADAGSRGDGRSDQLEREPIRDERPHREDEQEVGHHGHEVVGRAGALDRRDHEGGRDRPDQAPGVEHRGTPCAQRRPDEAEGDEDVPAAQGGQDRQGRRRGEVPVRGEERRGEQREPAGDHCRRAPVRAQVPAAVLRLQRRRHEPRAHQSSRSSHSTHGDEARLPCLARSKSLRGRPWRSRPGWSILPPCASSWST